MREILFLVGDDVYSFEPGDDIGRGDLIESIASTTVASRMSHPEVLCAGGSALRERKNVVNVDVVRAH
jgi:hypothetical protein